MDIVHIRWPAAQLDERPLPKGTYGADKFMPVDGNPEYEIGDDEPGPPPLWFMSVVSLGAAALMWGMAYLVHGVFG